MKIALIVAASTGLLAAASGARADLITDGGFETVAALSSGAYQFEASGSGASSGGTVGGWLWTTGAYSNSSAVVINVGNGSNSPWIRPATQTGFGGSYVAGLQGLGGVSQTFADSTNSGNFDLSYALAGRGGSAGGDQTVNVALLNLTTSTVVFTSSVSATSGSSFTTYNNEVSLILGDNYTLSFAGTTNNGTDETALLDNVSVVPEPSSLALLGASLFGLAFLRRRAKV